MRRRLIAELAYINPPLKSVPNVGDLISFISMAGIRERGGIEESSEVPFGSVCSGFTRFQEGDVLFAKITPCMENGKGALATNLKGGVGCGSTEFHVLRARHECIAPYLYHLMQWNCTRQKAEIFMSGSAGQQRVQSTFFQRYKVYAPSISVQKRIAAILTVIDTAIEKTEALIAKYQQIKAGLMHDLFTRGVLPNGQLRPPREQAPALYQETVIGWVPCDWEVIPLRHCLINNPTNGIYKSADQIGAEGVLMVGQTAFTTERSIDFSLCRRGTVGDEDLRRYSLSKGDILVTRVFATVQGVGLPTLVPELSEPAVFESNMMRLQVDARKIIPRFLFEWLRSPAARRYVYGGANASNQCSVNQTVLNPLPVIYPRMDEQARIDAVCDHVDKRHAQECFNLLNLRQQKQGLMQDLLTGKVQVHVDEETAPTEAVA